MDNTSHHTSPYNQHAPGFGPTPYHNRSNGPSSLPSAGAIVGPNTSGYFSPAPPPAAYYGPPPPGSGPQQQQQQVMFHNHPPHPPPQHPGMFDSTPSPHPPQVFLGFVNTLYTSRPIYVPPGAHFDELGNLCFEHADGSREWIGPYYDGAGRIVPNPNQRAEEGCCSAFC